MKTQSVNANMDWKFSFENLDKFKNGEEVIYTLEDVPVLECTSVISDNSSEGFKVVNSRLSETVDLSDEKRWVDSNEEGARTEPISISLTANGVKVETIEVSVKVSGSLVFGVSRNIIKEGSSVIVSKKFQSVGIPQKQMEISQMVM